MGKILLGNIRGPSLLGLAASGDPTGVTDYANIQGVLNLAGLAVLQPGIFTVTGSAPLTLATAGTKLQGSGEGNTFLSVASSFTGASVISPTADKCSISALSVVGASSTITSNPVANAIGFSGVQGTKIHDVSFQYINGWCIDAQGGASRASVDTMADRIIGRNCAGGIRCLGVTGSSFLGEYFLTDIQLQQIGVASGGSANLDGIRIEDISDVLLENYNGGVSDVSTGSTLHIKGKCSTIKGTNIDIGVFPNTSPNQSVILVEDSSNGSPGSIDLISGVCQQGKVGLTISGAASTVQFQDFRFSNNYTHGVLLSGTGSQVNFEECTWTGNGNGATGTNYDLDVTSSVTGEVKNCHFRTAIVATSSAGVQAAVNLFSSGQAIDFHNTEFVGTGVALSTVFNGNLPRRVRGCLNFNPHGPPSGFSTPATTVATSAIHYDCYHYITAGTGGCTIVRNTNGAGGGAGPSITIPAGHMGTIFCPAMGTLTPTYTNAPTAWVVDGI